MSPQVTGANAPRSPGAAWSSGAIQPASDPSRVLPQDDTRRLSRSAGRFGGRSIKTTVSMWQICFFSHYLTEVKLWNLILSKTTLQAHFTLFYQTNMLFCIWRFLLVCVFFMIFKEKKLQQTPKNSLSLLKKGAETKRAEGGRYSTVKLECPVWMFGMNKRFDQITKY